MKLNALPNTVVNPGTRLLLASQDANRQQHRSDAYTVRSGDTLYDIALATGTTVASLIALNDLQGSVIQPGQELRVTDMRPYPRPASIVVTVDAGDTLWEIARTHGLTVEDVTRENGLAADATLRPGDRLRLPGHDSPDAHDLGGAISEEVTVGAGDSLWEIARRYDTSVPALRSANDLASDRIYAGQRLWIIPNNELHPATDGSAYPSLPQRIRWPVPGVVTSRFGYRTLRLNGSNFHNALDIDGETGEPVKAAASGVVAFSGWRGNYGNLVVVRAGNVEYRYAHNSELLVGEGQAVAAGETIARVGNTGLSFGDHVHFEVRIDGTPVDPLPLLESKLR
jgi:murein DD-endopeptidase MepM/ murein hydrolase activator NlpD